MNSQIKEIIKQSRFFNYEIAEAIGISEISFSKWFRKPINEEKKNMILCAIEKLKDGERDNE